MFAASDSLCPCGRGLGRGDGETSSLGGVGQQVGWVERSDTQRIRLDCDREASHNLNRLLDEPGPECWSSLIENIFLEIAPV